MKPAPGNAEAWYNKGFALSELGEDEEAIKALDKALELDPESSAIYLRARILEMGGGMSFRRKASEILGHPASSLFLDPAGSRVVKL